MTDSHDARQFAQRAVCDALTGRHFAGESLAAAAPAERRAMAPATEIALGALRHVVTIEHVLAAVARYDARRVTPPLRSVLLTGAYQAIWQGDVPLFAIVDESVKLAKRVAGRPAAGMANAVLRRLAGAIRARRTDWVRLDPAQVRVSWDQACAFHLAVLPADEESYVAAAAGESPPRYAALAAVFGAPQAERIAWASQAVPVVVLHRNPLRVSAADFRARAAAELGPGAEVGDDAAYLRSASIALESSLFREGAAHVQDPTAHAAVARLGAIPGETILDLCAAPGGKSIVLAQRMLDRGRIVAADARDARLARVRENAARMGLRCIEAVPLAAIARDVRFDAAVVDAPCSNTGVIARRPEARLSLSARKTASLCRLQRDLLEEAAGRVRPGGRLLYSTCSLEPAENADVVRAFLSDHADWAAAAPDALAMPDWGARLADWRDGGYTALLRRA